MDTQAVLIQRAVDVLGSQQKLSDAIADVVIKRGIRGGGANQISISNWIREARTISPENALAVDIATNGRVSKAQLRPDVFDDANSTKSA